MSKYTVHIELLEPKPIALALLSESRSGFQWAHGGNTKARHRGYPFIDLQLVHIIGSTVTTAIAISNAESFTWEYHPESS